MIIVDVESTGVDAKLCSLLSVGALDFDNPKNQFYMECYAFPGAHIEKEALVVAGFTEKEIEPPSNPPSEEVGREEKSAGPADLPAPNTARQAGSATSFNKGGIKKKTDREVVLAFLEWMRTCKEWTLAGQNVSFDRDFLMETAHRYHIDWPLAQRTLDLHTVAYVDYLKRGKEIPRKNNHSALNLEAILEHVGVHVKREKHNALEDAKFEAEAFSRLIAGKPLLSEYRRFPVSAGL